MVESMTNQPTKELDPSKPLPNVGSAVQPSPPTQEATIYSAITKLAENDKLDTNKLEKLIELNLKMEDRQNEKAFNKALSLFQGECPPIIKTKSVSYGKTFYTYSPLDEIVEAVKPLLRKHGLSFSFDCEHGKDISVLKTTIHHEDGHSKTYSYSYPTVDTSGQKNVAQSYKSALSYAKRAALENALGVVTTGEDDDARRAGQSNRLPSRIETLRDICKKVPGIQERLIPHVNSRFKKEYLSLEELSPEEINYSIEFISTHAQGKKQ